MVLSHVNKVVRFLAASLLLSHSDGTALKGRSMQSISISRFALIDADTDLEIESDVAGKTISLDDLPTSNLNVEAVTEGGTLPDAVQFDYNGVANYRTEKKAPYALCGDSNGDFKTCTDLVEGSHSITATATQNGDAVSSYTGSFTLVPTTQAPTSPSTTSAPSTFGPSTAGPSSEVPTIGPTSEPSSAPPTSTPPVSSVCDVPFAGPDYDITSAGLEAVEIIDTSCVAGDIVISMTVSQIGDMEDSGNAIDTLSTFIKIDDMPEEPWFYIAGGVFTSLQSTTVTAGNELQIRTVGDTSAGDEEYYIRNFEVLDLSPTEAPTDSPTEMPSSEPTVAPTIGPTSDPSSAPPTSTPPVLSVCDVPFAGPNYDITSAGLEAVEIIDTSCVAGDIVISMTVSQIGDMEDSGNAIDTLSTFIKIDDMPEEPWFYIAGGVFTSLQSTTVTAGNELQIRTVGDTSAGDEEYYIRNFEVLDLSPTEAPTDSPTEMPIPTNSPKPTAAALVSGEMQKWHKITVAFTGPSVSETDSNNPFLNYRMDVTFTHADTGKQYIVPGYFAADGDAANTSASSGDQWICHFSPDGEGVWEYSASFVEGVDIAVATSGGNPVYFDGQGGSFVIAPTNKSGRDHRGKGMLQYVGQSHLKFAETGLYFLKCGSDSPENFLAYEDFDNTPRIGATIKTWEPHAGDYVSGDPTWQGFKGTEIIGAINYLSGVGMNAFSFLTMNIDGDDKNVYPYLSTDPSDHVRMDVSKLAQWEIVFEHADKMGMFLHFKTQEKENSFLLDGGEFGGGAVGIGTERKLYYRELVARFGHHLALNWNLGEEVLNDSDQLKAFATYFKTVDPYRHPVVMHTAALSQSKYIPMLGYPDFDGPSIQRDIEDVFDISLQWRTESEQNGHPWIVSNDEQQPSSDGVMADVVSPNNQDTIRKKVLWGNVMAGGAGVEYYYGHLECTDINCQDYRSRHNMWTVSNYALGFFRDYSIPFWEMFNANSRVADNDWVLTNEQDTLVVYRPDNVGTTIDMTGLSGTFFVSWFDPRNGGPLQTGTVLTIQGGSVSSYGDPIPAPVLDEDWVILIEK